MTTKTLEDAQLQILVSQAKEGDTEAYGKIYDHYFASVYRYTTFRVPAEVAEDLVAEVFVKAWEKLHTYKERKGIPFSAWLFRIVRHSVIDAYRAHKGWDEMTDNMVDPDEWNRADNSLKRADLQKMVRNALNGLPKRYREVLLLSYMAELPHGEVARVLRLTEGAVRILKFRALKKLEKQLPENAREVRAVYAL